MLIDVLCDKTRYTTTEIATLLPQGGWIITHTDLDNEGKAYAAVIASDGSVKWWEYAPDTLIPWADTQGDDTLIFDTLPETLETLEQLPCTNDTNDIDITLLTAWLNKDWRIPESLVHLVVQSEQLINWEDTNVLELKQKLIDVAAYMMRRPFQLTIHGDNNKGRHISQKRQDANMQAMMERYQTTTSWPGQNEYYEGVAYAEVYANGIDISDPVYQTFIDVSREIMTGYDCNLEGWTREYNDGAYDAASGYSANQDSIIIEIEGSNHDLFEQIDRGHKILVALNTACAQKALQKEYA